MKNKPIPKKKWRRFCEKFSKDHEGWLVTVIDLKDTPKGKNGSWDRAAKHCVVRDQKLQRGIPFRDGKETGVLIITGEGNDRVTHVVNAPSQLTFERGYNGAHKGLCLDEGEHHKTLLRFDVPVLNSLS